LRLLRFSRPVDSTTLAPFQVWSLRFKYTEKAKEFKDALMKPSGIFVCSYFRTNTKEKEDIKMAINVGSKAPEFTLFDTEKKSRSLSEFRGKKVVLVFYPGAFTGVCTKEMCAFRDTMAKFSEINAQVIGISVDASFATKAFATQNNLQFPLLSDYSREVIRQYCGVYEDFAGLKGYTASKRSVFIVDGNGIVKYAWISENPGVEPEYDEIVKALK
jgi:peroxiredoxin